MTEPESGGDRAGKSWWPGRGTEVAGPESGGGSVASAAAVRLRRAAAVRVLRAQPVVRIPDAKVALSTASVYPELTATAFEIAARLGYDGVEVMVWTDPVNQDIEALRRLSDYHQVPILAVHAPCLLITQRVWSTDPWVKLQRARAAAESSTRPPSWSTRRFDGSGPTPASSSAESGGWPMRPMCGSRSRTCTRGAIAIAEMLAYAPDSGRHPARLPPLHDRSVAHRHRPYGRDRDGRPHGRPAGPSPPRRRPGLQQGRAPGAGRGTQPCAELLERLATTGFDGNVVVEVNTRRAMSTAEREADLAEALAFTRLHLASPTSANPSSRVVPGS
ncbi:Xylose isomerase-like TIM barrel domain-containing protein OS=Streptomyces antimycoticus OX=68175 GN=SANT12839_053570 PE=4 SV=1 [Streptomyces antimycoticus]